MPSFKLDEIEEMREIITKKKEEIIIFLIIIENDKWKSGIADGK